MANVTLKVLEGADRGQVYADLVTPVTIGREEGNTIQLNDERVSRFHLKIQEDHDQLVLTDLESTNGTKVNGDEVQLRILRFGDRISVGRSVLWFGSDAQIASRLQGIREGKGDVSRTMGEPTEDPPAADLDFELSWSRDPSQHATLHTLETPPLPPRLSPAQAAHLAEILEYFHIRLRALVDTVEMDDQEERVTLDQRQWQNLLDIQSRLAIYLRQIGEPESGAE